MANNSSGSLDTNTLLRLSLGDIPEQALCVKKLLDQSSYFEVADAVIFEIVFVMEKGYGLERKQIAQNILTIVRHPKINSNRELFERTITNYIQHPKLSIVDCALVQYAKLNKAIPLYTFDQALAKDNPDTVRLLSSHD